MNEHRKRQQKNLAPFLWASQPKPRPLHGLLSDHWADPRLSLNASFKLWPLHNVPQHSWAKPQQARSSQPAGHSVPIESVGWLLAPLFGRCGMFRSQLGWRPIRPRSVPARTGAGPWGVRPCQGKHKAGIQGRLTTSHSPSNPPESLSRRTELTLIRVETQTNTHRLPRGCVGAHVRCPW